MKLSTAATRLTDVVDGLDRAVQWPEASLSAAFVFGAALDGAADLDRVDVAVVVTEAPEVVPWMSRPAYLEALAAGLRFTNLPVSWKWRPAEWPVWNHEIERVAWIWTAAAGRDQAVLEAFASGRLDLLLNRKAGRYRRAPRGTDRRTVNVGRRHLATVTASFHERDWRAASRRRHLPGGSSVVGGRGLF